MEGSKEVKVNEAVLKQYDLNVRPSVQFRYFPVIRQTINLRSITLKQVKDLCDKGDKTFSLKKSK